MGKKGLYFPYGDVDYYGNLPNLVIIRSVVLW